MERSDTWRPATDKMLKMSLASMVGVGIKVCYEPCKEIRVNIYFLGPKEIYTVPIPIRIRIIRKRRKKG